MTLEVAVDLLQRLVLVCLILVSPMLATAITVGVIVSLLQSVTSIQEQTLTFVPKLLAVSVVMMVSAHWLVRTLSEVAIEFVQRIPEMAP